MKDTLKYYKKINLIPTIDLSDYSKNKSKIIKAHRKIFFFKVGININDFENKDILEFCPGTGYSAKTILEKIKVNSYTLVDSNPQSLKYLRKNLKKYSVKIINKDIRKFKTKKKI